MKINRLEHTKRLYPHFFDKTDESNFTKHLKVVGKPQHDIRHKLKTVEWSRILEKPLQIWKEQTKPYEYTMHFKCIVPFLKNVNVYKNPILDDDEIVSYEDIVISRSFADDSVNYFEQEYHDETKTYSKGFYEKYGLDCTRLKHYPIPSASSNAPVSPSSQTIVLEDNFDGGDVLFDEISGNMTIEGSEVYDEDIDDTIYVTQFYPSSVELDGGVTTVFNFTLGTIIPPINSNTDWYDYNTLVIKVLGTNGRVYRGYEISGVVGDKFRIEINEDGARIYKNGVCQSLQPNGLSTFKIALYHEASDNRVVVLNDVSLEYENFQDYRKMIPSDTYLLEVETWDDYRFIKGFPENDYTVKEDNILNYRYNTTFLDISIEEISYTKYLTFRVHKDKIKKIVIYQNDAIFYKETFEKDFIRSTSSTDLSYYYYDALNTNEDTYSEDASGYMEVEDISANNDRVFVDNTNVDEYVYRLALSNEDFDENGVLKDIYDLEVTTYEKRYWCLREYDKVYSKRYNGYDNQMNDCFDHDYSLDIIGNLLNIHRFKFYQVYRENNSYYSRTYPSYNDKATEDDYHYMKRIQYYISNYNHIVFPVLEFWKYYYITPTILSRKRVVDEMDYAYFHTSFDGCGEPLESFEETFHEKTGQITEYSINKATSIRGKGVVTSIGTWYEAILVNNLYVVPSADYWLRVGIKNNEEDVTVRMICYNRKGVELRTSGIVIDELSEEGQQETHDTDTEFTYINTKITIPSDTVSIRLLLESDSGFDFDNTTFKRMTVLNFDNYYIGTDTDYNSNVYELHAMYDDIPTNIRMGSTERYNVLLKRSLPLTKRGYLFLDIGKDLNNVASINTETKLYLQDLVQVSEHTMSDSPYEIEISNHITGGKDYNLSYKILCPLVSEDFDETEITTQVAELYMDSLVTVTVYYYSSSNSMIDSETLEKEVFADTLTKVTQKITTPTDTTHIKLKFEAEEGTLLKNIKLGREQELSNEEVFG